MGQEKITEHVEVTNTESVHLCDFCGRSSEEFDGSFKDVHKNGKIKSSSPSDYMYKNDDGTYYVGGWLPEHYLIISSTEQKHFCSECHAAHIGVHNDDS